jgi:protein associated with RNAse G/E
MNIEVRAHKHDGTSHLRYAARQLEPGAGAHRTYSPPGTELFSKKGIELAAEDLYGHFWPDRWFNVLRYTANEAHPAGWYCNVASPATFDDASISYVDYELDIRVLVGSDGALEWHLLDEDEFEEARLLYGYDDELVQHCREAVEQLIAMIEAREFPFDVSPQTGE